jgi:hypothetical protein
MRRIALVLILAAAGLSVPLHAQYEMSREALVQMSVHYRFFEMLDDDEEGRARYVYADERPHLHVYAVEKNGWSELQWETILGSQVRGLQIVTTLAGEKLIVVATAKGKVFAYDANDYHLVRENLLEPFSSIQAMMIAQLDRDRAQEVILLGVLDGTDEPLLYVYDGDSRALQWQSQDTFIASEILVADLDDDPQPEIVLNNGVIIDSRFRTIEIDHIQEGGFGVRLRLLDINADGYPEIFGTTLGDQIRVYDPYAKRRLW